MSAAVVMSRHFAGGLLGRHVRGRAEQRAGERAGRDRVGVDALGDAEVGDVRDAVDVEEDVRGLQVAMEHAAAVAVVDGAAQVAMSRAAAIGVAVLLEVRGEVAALDELHRVEVPALVRRRSRRSGRCSG